MTKLGSKHWVEITDLTDKGDGVGTLLGRPLFVEGALPGDEVEVKLTQIKPNYLHGLIGQIGTPAAERVDDFCAHQACGGCQVRTLSYQGQLAHKQQLVQREMQRFGLNCEVKPVLGMAEPFAWRNKAQFAVRQIDGGAEIGFYRKHSHQLVACDDCAVQDPLHIELLARLRQWLQQHDVRAYDEHNHSGDLRHVVTRKGFATGEVMLVLVTRTEVLPAQAELLAQLADLNLTTIVHNVHGERGNRVMGLDNRVLTGNGVIRDTLDGLDFIISPLSFYQVNPSQTEVLYKQALQLAELTGNETVYDLYCGIGTISLFLARHASKVIGIELIPEAIADAEENAKANGLSNTEFHVGRAEVLVPELYQQGVSADVVVVDPPRKGCDQALLQTLTAMAPKTLVYVSCNPKTLARDLAWLTANGFSLEQLQPVDMFPHTLHVEAVAQLRWQG
ncbi:23S rRNA (uracil(1939)-C(5))-methyltransferase RlmD [Ferrimonas senticii]|uniref:23S rRNA (uracil(1939)-C(5))-methyltransferase RlmD n=1 Tax=Ferrimonas senticii TaxID=394566 RepID=UPI000411F1E7|nr:23S rRNA (uracil(1939)-C(5))-methyltransferase RlmD [Ferrimonas senticii]